ncbi:hypothetical protein BO94DRAFT_548022 [Aspergillus sclerotioniger CBS 115572]|uniref:Cell wall protein n=1 Tax=Aspergillus sclerotioniger CBS 115572 TaxID=1450535 RepID=A0A317W6T0_9EURO|nr:hypothetical protein BO94DRAFT_548022 [Aspergillus sclerotioniger CBS 115572]PWY81759.1 hypothetical protein BO94DRAFT_548022 [Aspergillus sclerotioniger CBS 115572]
MKAVNGLLLLGLMAGLSLAAPTGSGAVGNRGDDIPNHVEIDQWNKRQSGALGSVGADASIGGGVDRSQDVSIGAAPVLNDGTNQAQDSSVGAVPTTSDGGDRNYDIAVGASSSINVK